MADGPVGGSSGGGADADATQQARRSRLGRLFARPGPNLTGAANETDEEAQVQMATRSAGGEAPHDTAPRRGLFGRSSRRSAPPSTGHAAEFGSDNNWSGDNPLYKRSGLKVKSTGTAKTSQAGRETDADEAVALPGLVSGGCLVASSVGRWRPRRGGSWDGAVSECVLIGMGTSCHGSVLALGNWSVAVLVFALLVTSPLSPCNATPLINAPPLQYFDMNQQAIMDEGGAHGTRGVIHPLSKGYRCGRGRLAVVAGWWWWTSGWRLGGFWTAVSGWLAPSEQSKATSRPPQPEPSRPRTSVQPPPLPPNRAWWYVTILAACATGWLEPFKVAYLPEQCWWVAAGGDSGRRLA
jgi:hypothetical protein